MDQVKIGRFIAQRRKLAGLTQAQLAEKLAITDRAVSKWETGKSLPDASIMLDLCDILKIKVNDLLSGEVVTVDNYNEKLEKNLIEMVREKELADKRLLFLEIIICALATALLLGVLTAATVIEMPQWARVVLIALGFAAFLVGATYALKIEQIAGYYLCAKCGHRYVPTFKQVFFAPHVMRIRHMRCPKCGQKSWQKKVLSRE